MLIACRQKSYLEPSHDEEKLQEGEYWQEEISLVSVQVLSTEQTSQEERVNGYCHNLQQKQPKRIT